MSGYNAGYNSEWLIYSWQYIICLFMWSHPFFSESCFLATNIWKKIREKIRSEKNEVWGCVGWGGEVDQWNRKQCLTFLECITALFWWAELKQFCPLPKVIPTVVVVVVWFGLFVCFFSFSQSWLQNCRSSCLLNVSMYTTSFGRCCGVSLSLCFSVRQLVCIILVVLFFKFLSVLVRPRPNVEPLRWIPSTVPEVRTAVQNFIIISLGGYT